MTSFGKKKTFFSETLFFWVLRFFQETWKIKIAFLTSFFFTFYKTLADPGLMNQNSNLVSTTSNHCKDCDLVLWGKLEENSDEILSVALLSPACYSIIVTAIQTQFELRETKLLVGSPHPPHTIVQEADVRYATLFLKPLDE